MAESPKLRFFYNAIAVFLGFTFWSAGMVKLFAGHEFIGWIGPPQLVEALAKHDLELYGKFIAYAQIVIGYMLMTTRFTFLGAVMLVPMIVNILMVTISQNWVGTPYVLSVLLVMNFVLLYRYKAFGRAILFEDLSKSDAMGSLAFTWKGHTIWFIGLIANIVAVSWSHTDYWTAVWIVAGGFVLSLSSVVIKWLR
jgi:hypothetical protein